MAEWTGARVRQQFIDFFCEKYAHDFVRSSSVVPLSDPTLLFTNAGMNQYKPIFLGTADPQTELGKLKRAANSQKCIRAGGKHNDLDDVGKDTYHHTFFEMLGNWSFGDYFKEEAIAWAWELLTVVYGLPADRLYATYFEGDVANGLEPDFEAKALWEKYLPAAQIIPGDAKDNFWEMGETGPCGPCSEIHFDRIGGRNAADIVNKDDPNVIEIWNIVFMQFNRQADATLVTLPNKHIDTGMGLERIVSILQNKMSNYDTDLFTPIFAAIKEATKCEREYQGKVGEEDVDGFDMAYRVVADHIRTLVFAITDGAAPGANDRDYVIRRVCRRAARFGRQLGGQTGFFSSLVGVVVDVMHEAFPELVSQREKVERIIREEEEVFAKTLEKGIRQFDKMTADMPAGAVVSGEDAFLLYESFGFPVDLTLLMAEERKLSVDDAGFKAQLAAAQERSRQGGKTEESGGAVMDLSADSTDYLVKANIPTTDDSFKYIPQIDNLAVEGAKVLALALPTGVSGVQKFDDTVSDAGLVGVVLDKTCFYAESGGQVFDIGTLESDDGKVVVKNTQVFAGYILHIGTLTGTLSVGTRVRAAIDSERRKPIMANHTMTHVLNFALRDVLVFHGEDVTEEPSSSVDQKGSLVDEQKLRFDFGNGQGLTDAEIAAIEKECNQVIERDLTVSYKNVPLKEALAIKSLRAVFGEVYPDPVRVVSIGPAVSELVEQPDNFKDWKGYSIELCGGTHLAKTSQAGRFAVLAESGIAQGVRRIVAVTGNEADKAVALADEFQGRIQALLDSLAALEGKATAEAQSTLAKFNEDLAGAQIPHTRRVLLKSMSAEAFKKLAASGKNVGEASAKAAEDIVGELTKDTPAFFVREWTEAAGDLKALDAAFQVLKKNVVNGPLAVPVLICTHGADKKGPVVHIKCSVPQEKSSKLKAGEWAGHAAQVVGGKGGGKPTDAQARGSDPSKLAEMLESASAFAESKL